MQKWNELHVSISSRTCARSALLLPLIFTESFNIIALSWKAKSEIGVVATIWLLQTGVQTQITSQVRWDDFAKVQWDRQRSVRPPAYMENCAKTLTLTNNIIRHAGIFTVLLRSGPESRSLFFKRTNGLGIRSGRWQGRDQIQKRSRVLFFSLQMSHGGIVRSERYTLYLFTQFQ